MKYWDYEESLSLEAFFPIGTGVIIPNPLWFISTLPFLKAAVSKIIWVNWNLKLLWYFAVGLDNIFPKNNDTFYIFKNIQCLRRGEESNTEEKKTQNICTH